MRDEPYHFIVANIIKSAILSMLSKLSMLLRSDGTLILSGLLEADLSEIEDGLHHNGFDNFSTVRDNEWFTYIVTGGG
jgi:ribosomal protein L11 methylase PrmA